MEGLKLTQPQKEQLYSNLKIQLEQRNVKLPPDTDLLNSLNSIMFTRTRTGGFSFNHREGTYDDLGVALALAVYAASREKEGG